jgi:hypothetical protein
MNMDDYEFDDIEFSAIFDRMDKTSSTGSPPPINFDTIGDQYQVVQEGGHGISRAVLPEDENDSNNSAAVEGGGRATQLLMPRNMDDQNNPRRAEKRAHSPEEAAAFGKLRGLKHHCSETSLYDNINIKISSLMGKIRAMIPTDSKTALHLFNTTLADLHSELCEAEVMSSQTYSKDSEVENRKAYDKLRQDIQSAEVVRIQDNNIILDMKAIALQVARLDQTPSPTLSTYTPIIPEYFKCFYKYQALVSGNNMNRTVMYPSQQEHDFFLDVEVRFIRFHFDADYAKLSFYRKTTNVLLLKNNAGKYLQDFGDILNNMKTYTSGKTQGHRMAWTRQFYPWCKETEIYYKTYCNIVPVLDMIHSMETDTLDKFKATHGTMRNYHTKLQVLLDKISNYEETYDAEPALPSPEKRQEGWAPFLKYKEYIMWYATMESEKSLRKPNESFSDNFLEVQMKIITYEAAPDDGLAHIAFEIRCFFFTS